MRRSVLTSVLCVLLPTLLMGADDVAQEKAAKALQGTWKVVSAEKDGAGFDRIVGGTMKIKDINFVITTKGGTEMEGDLRIDAAAKPKTLDLVHQKGLLPDKTWKAIYSLDGDELKLCYVELDSDKDPERPKEFKTADGDGHLLIVLKREK